MLRSSIRPALGAAALAMPAAAQTTLDRPLPPPQPYAADSGVRANPALLPVVVFEETVFVRNAAWLRLYFGDVALEGGGVVRMTSLLDDEVQELDADALAAWSHTSAYFNGDALLVELVAAPGSSDNRLVIDAVAFEIGFGMPAGGLCGICGEDDRNPTGANWAGRLLPAGCSASVWNEQSCLVSAGHCLGADMVIQFNVPLSDPDCSINHPPVSDQFPLPTWMSQNEGPGNDWMVTTSGVNDLGETIIDRFGLVQEIATAPAQVGQILSVTGYGTDTECELAYTQQTSGGMLQAVTPLYYTHDVDTTFGNSGSAIRNSGPVGPPDTLAIATHCNCPQNIGTRVDQPSFASARTLLCPDPPPDCPFDLDGSGHVGIADLLQLLADWGNPYGIADLLDLLAAWGPCP